MKKYIISKYNLVALILGATLFFSCENELEKVNIFVNKETQPIMIGEDVEIVYTENAKPNMLLKAASFEKYEKKEKPYSDFTKGINILFYDDNEQVSSSMKSNKAKYFEKEKLWEAKEKVKVVNVEGDILTTELLYWDETNEKIYSNEHVRIQTEDEILYGIGFESDEKFTKYKIKKLKGTVAL